MRPYEDIFEYLENMKKDLRVLCDQKELNYSLYHIVQNNEHLSVVSADNPIKLMKALKNEVETKNTYEAYLQDGIAEAEFYAWLFEALENGETFIPSVNSAITLKVTASLLSLLTATMQQ